MVDFEATGVLDTIEVTDSAIRDAEQQIQEGVGGVSAGGRGGRRGGGGVAASAGGVSVVDTLSEQLDVLEDIEDKLDQLGSSGLGGGGGGGGGGLLSGLAPGAAGGGAAAGGGLLTGTAGAAAGAGILGGAGAGAGLAGFLSGPVESGGGVLELLQGGPDIPGLGGPNPAGGPQLGNSFALGRAARTGQELGEGVFRGNRDNAASRAGADARQAIEGAVSSLESATISEPRWLQTLSDPTISEPQWLDTIQSAEIPEPQWVTNIESALAPDNISQDIQDLAVELGGFQFDLDAGQLQSEIEGAIDDQTPDIVDQAVREIESRLRGI